ncbi:dTDP-4-dehydrorhamnose reductase [Aeromonas veronii]
MTPVNVWLYGATGQLGKAIVSQLADTPWLMMVEQDRRAFACVGLFEHGASEPRSVPTVIINAAAFTYVERAEHEPALAWMVNRDGVARLAALAKQHNALLVHFSTDYLFDGTGDRPWRESDDPAPLNVYGRSKWAGEQAIMASGCRYLIVRTSWLHSPWRHNFLKTMLHLGQCHDELNVVCDQIGAPTSATWLAQVTIQAIERVLAEPALAGLYHVAASGAVSWHEYADFIFSEAKAMGLIDKVPTLLPVASAHYPSPVIRPLNSRLDCAHFCDTFAVQLPDWRVGVTETLQQLLKTR